MFMGKRCQCSSRECPQSKADLKSLSDNLTLLSVKSRLDILFLLKDKPHCVCDLITHTNMSQSLISHHLSDLACAGFVESKRAGKYIDYDLTSEGKNLVKTLMSMMNKKGGENKNG
jgi:ArsR family transcriptional regulator, arsenate/arsenite/antimonite-responsive transcriptional repressor